MSSVGKIAHDLCMIAAQSVTVHRQFELRYPVTGDPGDQLDVASRLAFCLAG